MHAQERVKGIGPSYLAWKASVLPLNYTRKMGNAQNRNRTSDTWIFSPLLYQLSYLGMCAGDRARTGTGFIPQDFKSCASANSATPAVARTSPVIRDNRYNNTGAFQSQQLFFVSSRRQTAWAAIPSSLPVKPSFSSVVALTLIREGSVSSAAAIFDRISSV